MKTAQHVSRAQPSKPPPIPSHKTSCALLVLPCVEFVRFPMVVVPGSIAGGNVDIGAIGIAVVPFPRRARGNIKKSSVVLVVEELVVEELVVTVVVGPGVVVSVVGAGVVVGLAWQHFCHESAISMAAFSLRM